MEYSDHCWDGAQFYKPRKLRQSANFQVGQQIPDTLFTVVGPGYEDRYGNRSWRKVKCYCDPQYGGCGETVTIAYIDVYRYPPRFSCGCKSRKRWNEHDHTGESVTGYNTSRTLTILFYDEDRRAWLYVCDCCGDTGYVPRGQGQSTLIKLRAIARQPCPNAPRFYQIDELPDIERHVLLSTKTRIDADLIDQLQKNYPHSKLVFGGYENRICGIETSIRPNPAPKKEPPQVIPVVGVEPTFDESEFENLDTESS